MSSALKFTSELIEFDSVSSKSNIPVTERVEDYLSALGFELERVNYLDARGVPKANVIGKLGRGIGGIGYFCHTDVVPVLNWEVEEHGAFQPRVRDGKLYGRGSTDMKGSLACMLEAVQQISSRPLKAPIYITCTGDEEVGMLGAEHVANRSQFYREMVAGQTRGIIGEPTKFQVVYGHKGGTGIRVTSHGIAGHSSSRDGINANWKMIPFLQEMKTLYEELETDLKWQNPEFDPPTTTMNLGICDHNPAMNVTANISVCTIYFRAMPSMDVTPVIERIQHAATHSGLDFEMISRSTPFYRDAKSQFVQECLDFSPGTQPLTVAYGTDAARFGDLANCVIMGPGDIAQAHTGDEFILCDDLVRGTAMYRAMIERWCL